MLDVQEKTKKLFASISHTRTIVGYTGQLERFPLESNRSKIYNNQMKELRGPHVRLKLDARIISKQEKCTLVILDVGKDPILTISSHDIRDSIELVYNPPCSAFPGGHFDAYVKGKVVTARSIFDDDGNDMLYSAIEVVPIVISYKMNSIYERNVSKFYNFLMFEVVT